MTLEASEPWIVQSETPPLEAALAYARSGFRVAWINGVVINAETQKAFCTCRNKKCAAHGKHPVFTNWQREASTDPEVLRDQFSRLRFTPNVGIVLGDGHISIDVDSHERLTELEAQLGVLPMTLTGRSARGARLFFKAPSDKIRNAAAIGDKPGVDIKSKGGQVVVAPSLHASGARYTWDYPLAPVSELPAAWVLFLMPKDRPVPPELQGYTPSTLKLDAQARRKADKYLQRAVHEECSRLVNVSEGGRNLALHSVLCRLLPLAHGLSLSGGHEYVIGECTKASVRAGLPDREIARTIRSVEDWMAKTGAVRVPHLAEVAPVPQSDRPLHEPLEISLTLDQSRKPAKLASNVAEILDHDPEWGGGPVLDELSMLTMWPLPLPEPIAKHRRFDREIVKADYLVIQEHCHRVHECRVGLEACELGVQLSVARKRYDSLEDHVRALPKWDGKRRLRTWLAKYMGCPEDTYHEHIGAAWLASAMHRAVSPGDVVDLIPVLIGKQKAGKNRAIETLFAGGPKGAPFLAPLSRWSPDHPDTKRLACSRWVLHDDEFSSRDERTVDALKSWASRDTEQWTPKYSNDVTVAPRRAVLIVSVNSDHPLKDPTGARRFGPIRVGDVDIEGLAKIRDQLLAEALTLHDRWRECLPDDELHEEATSAATEEDGLESAIIRITDWPEHGFSISELGERCGIRNKELTRSETTRLGQAAKAAKCKMYRVMKEGIRLRFYLRPGSG